MKRFFLIFALILSILNATPYSLEELKKKDNSLAKDYYIWRLFEENKISKKEAQSLRAQIFRYAGKIKKELEKYVPPRAFVDSKYAKCFNYTAKNILDANATCQNYRLNSLAFISSLSPQTRTKLAAKFENNKDLKSLLLAFNEKTPLQSVIKTSNSSYFFKVYDYFKKPDLSLESAFLDKIAVKKEFKNFARNIIINKTHPKLRASFLNISPLAVSDDSAFYLGLNALLFDKESRALLFFNSAYNSFENANLKDNALFWIYQISKADTDLNTLAKSKNINIYSLYAKELKNEPLPEITTPKLRDKKINYDMKDPFLWQSLSKKIQKSSNEQLKALAKDFESVQTINIYAYIMEKADKFRKNYFIMPYFEYLKDYDKERQALILALARQESRFIPSAISTSYALGMMQFMPFVANHIAFKEMKLDKFDPDEMFDPKTAYFFANHHLNYLEKEVKNVVFISYAYNGGIGFTKRMLAREDMFKKGKFEPFLSMEFVPYQESRNYAKYVLANYIVYLNLLNGNTKILSIFESLIADK